MWRRFFFCRDTTGRKDLNLDQRIRITMCSPLDDHRVPSFFSGRSEDSRGSSPLPPV